MFQEACDGVIGAAEAKEGPGSAQWINNQISDLNQDNFGGPVLMGAGRRRQRDEEVMGTLLRRLSIKGRRVRAKEIRKQ